MNPARVTLFVFSFLWNWGNTLCLSSLGVGCNFYAGEERDKTAEGPPLATKSLATPLIASSSLEEGTGAVMRKSVSKQSDPITN